jgi:PAS domain S-box-containing protein
MTEAREPLAKNATPSAAEALRRRAEELLDGLSEGAGVAASPAPQDIVAAVHELRVYQVELEMQNEELRRAELELDAQRAKYFELFDLAPVGYLTVGDRGIVGDANFTAAHLLGVERQTLVGQPFGAFVFEPDRDVDYLHQRSLRQTGEPQTYELRLRRAIGAAASADHFWARLDVQPQPATDGEQRLFWVTFSDITDARQAQAALRDSEQWYRALLENANDAVHVVGLSTSQPGRFIDVNERACAMLGYSREELLGMTTADIDIPTQARRAALVKRLQDECSATFETEHLAKDGGRIPVEVSASRFELRGEPIVLAVVREITARRLAEAYRETGREVLRILNDPGDLQDSIQRVVAALKRQTGLDAVGIRLRDGDEFPYVGQQGFSQDFLLTENTLVERGADGGVCRDSDGNLSLECTCGLVLSGKADPADPNATAGGSYWTNDSLPFLDLPLDQDPRLHPRNHCVYEGYASMALVPIRDTSGIVGLIHLNDRRKGCFSADTVELLEGIAAHIGAALLRKQAEQELHEAERRLLERSSRGESLNAALNEVNARLSASFELGPALDDVLEMACAALECDAALLATSGLGGSRVEHAFGIELADDIAVFDELSGTMSTDGPSVLAASSDGPHGAWLGARLGLAEAIVAPVWSYRGAGGALLLGRRDGEPRFDDQSTDFVQHLALSLGLALASAAQFEAERHVALALQDALLVMPAAIRGLEFSHLYRSATATTRVGGDFVDVFEMAEGRVGVLVGDVSGKGLEAAVLTSIIKHTIRAYARDTPSPALTVSRANLALDESAQFPGFASVFFGVVDGSQNSLTYCSAGHPPAALLGADGSVRLLEGRSPIIGAFPDVIYADHTVRFAPDETVLLYTDGVTEARSAEGVFFAEEGLLATLGSIDAADIAGLPTTVFDAVMTFSDGRLSDDIALLAFRHFGPASPKC